MSLEDTSLDPVEVEAAAPVAQATPTADTKTEMVSVGALELGDANQKTETAPVKDAATDKPAETAWPDDWREKIAGDDADLLRYLKRFTSYANAAKAGWNFRQQISKGDLRQKLPDNPTPEQLAEYRKAQGLPESIDKYDLPLPSGYTPPDEVKPVIDAFKAVALEQGIAPKQAAALLQFQLQQNEKIEQAKRDADMASQTSTERALKQKWGPDYEANISGLNAFLGQKFGDARSFLDMKLENGVRLGNDPMIVEAFAEFTRDSFGHTYSFGAEGAGSNQTSLADMKKQHTELYLKAANGDKQAHKEYYSPEYQQKVIWRTEQEIKAQKRA